MPKPKQTTAAKTKKVKQPAANKRPKHIHSNRCRSNGLPKKEATGERCKRPQETMHGSSLTVHPKRHYTFPSRVGQTCWVPNQHLLKDSKEKKKLRGTGGRLKVFLSPTGLLGIHSHGWLLRRAAGPGHDQGLRHGGQSSLGLSGGAPRKMWTLTLRFFATNLATADVRFSWLRRKVVLLAKCSSTCGSHMR